MSKLVIYNGQLTSGEEVLVSPVNRGMMYGDGCFDTFRSYKGKFLNLEAHFDRTKAAAEYLGIEVEFDFIDFKHKILELLGANGLLNQDALIRVQCWREGARGYSTDSVHGNWLTTSVPYSVLETLVSLSTVDTTVVPYKALDRRFKLSNGINYIIAAREARGKGADDALMLTIDEQISETTIANIFWIKENVYYTPSLECDLFPGITRNTLIKSLSESHGAKVIEGEFDLEEIKKADAVFTTNSLREITAVSAIDGVEFDIRHKLIGIAKESFEHYKRGNLK